MGAPFEGDVCGKGLASEMPDWVKEQIDMDDYVHYLKAPVGTWDGKTQRIYLDGQQMDIQAPGGILYLDGNGKLSNATETMDGMIDEAVRHALGAGESAAAAEIVERLRSVALLLAVPDVNANDRQSGRRLLPTADLGRDQ